MILLLTCTGSYFLLYKIPSNLTQCLVRHYLHTIFILRHFKTHRAICPHWHNVIYDIMYSYFFYEVWPFLFFIFISRNAFTCCSFYFPPKTSFSLSWFIINLFACVSTIYFIFSIFLFLDHLYFFLLIWNYNQQFIEIRYILCIEYT